jgi:hypothetical protein
MSTIEQFDGDPNAFWDGGHIDGTNGNRLTSHILGNFYALQ